MAADERQRAQVERIVVVAARARDVRVGDRIDHEKNDDDEG